MRWLHTLTLRFRSLFRRARVEDELDAELRFHLEEQIDEHRIAGMGVAEAHAAALRSLGGLVSVKEICRDSLGLRVLDELRQDGRSACRVLFTHPGFAL